MALRGFGSDLALGIHEERDDERQVETELDHVIPEDIPTHMLQTIT